MPKTVKINAKINRDALFDKLRIFHDTKLWRYADRIYGELYSIITGSINILAAFSHLDGKSMGGICGGRFGEGGAVCLITAGSSAGACIESAANDSTLKGFLLDAMINEVLFISCDELKDVLRDEHSGLFYGNAVFPGDGEINLEIQRDLLESSGLGGFLNVRVSESGMLIPLKSLMFVMPSGYMCSTEHSMSKCRECKNFDCIYRDRRQSEH